MDPAEEVRDSRAEMQQIGCKQKEPENRDERGAEQIRTNGSSLIPVGPQLVLWSVGQLVQADGHGENFGKAPL